MHWYVILQFYQEFVNQQGTLKTDIGIDVSNVSLIDTVTLLQSDILFAVIHGYIEQ